jgi:N-methylhydantoinase A
LHAVALARELGIPEVLVPARPGLTNALGCLVADLRQDRVNTLNRPLDGLDMAVVHDMLAAQRVAADATLQREAAEIADTQVLHAAEMQFRGQTHLIRVALPDAHLTRESMQALFEAAYFKRFQLRLPEIRANVVNLITSVIGRRRQLDLSALLDVSLRKPAVAAAKIAERRLYADGHWHNAAVYAREALPQDGVITGPAIVQQLDATTVIEPGAVARLDAIGNLRITV